MADYPEIFTFPPGRRRIHVREEFIGICAFAPTPLCAGMLLSVFERWTQYRLEERRKVVNATADRGVVAALPHLWIFMSAEQLYREILYTYSTRTIQANLQWLVDHKFLSRRNNPDKGWDRTYQYRLHFARIQHALNQYAQFGLYFDPPKSRPITKNFVMDNAKLHNALRKTSQALPRSSSRSSTRKRERVRKSAIPSPAHILRDTVKAHRYYQAYRAVLLSEMVDPQSVTLKNAPAWKDVIDALDEAGVQEDKLCAYILSRQKRLDTAYRFEWLAEDIDRIKPPPPPMPQPPLFVPVKHEGMTKEQLDALVIPEWEEILEMTDPAKRKEAS